MSAADKASPANLVAFPADRVVRSGRHGPGTITLIQGAERTSYASEAAFRAAIREADPELRRRLADAGTACERAALLAARANTVLERAAKQRRDLRQICHLLLLAALAASAAALVVFSLR